MGETLQRALQILSGTKKDAVGAANAWAGTTGLDLLGALNAKAGTKGLGLNAVAKAITGVTGEAATTISGLTQNVALGKTVTISAGGTNATRVTDGTTNDSSLYASASTGLQYAQVDLGSAQSVGTVRVWRYYADARTFLESKTEVSADGVSWTTVGDNRSQHGSNLLLDTDYDVLTTLPRWLQNYFGSVPALVTPGRTGSGNAVGITTSNTNPQGMTHQTPPGTAIPLGNLVRCGAWVKAPTGQQVFVIGQSAYTGINLLAGGDYAAASLPSDAAPNGVATVVIATGAGRTGNCARVTTTTTANQGLQHYTAIGTAIATNVTVRVGAWVKGTAGRTMSVAGLATSPDGVTNLGSGLGPVTFTTTGSWQYVETTNWTIGAAVFRPGIRLQSTASISGAVFDVDDVAAFRVDQIAENGGLVSFSATGSWQYVETKEWTVTSHAEATFRPGLMVRIADGSGAAGQALAMDDPVITARALDPETSAGKAYSFTPQSVRYIRDTINGSTVDTANRWVEIQATP